jgi:hypothetical protein
LCTHCCLALLSCPGLFSLVMSLFFFCINLLFLA